MKTIKERAIDIATKLLLSDLEDDACLSAVELLQELANAPEPEPVAHVTGYYAGYLSIATVDGRVLPTGTALYTAAQPAPSVPDGWRLVPETATVEMRNAGMAHLTGLTSYANSMALKVYGAMLAAAPQPPRLSDERILELWANNSGRPVTMGKARIIAQARAIEREILGGNE